MTNAWNANLYDTKHHYVTDYGASLINLLAPQPGEQILDLGCGTGHLAYQMAERGVQVIGLDNSADMIQMAQQNYPDLTFIQGDATAFHFDEPFDAIFSNAA